MRSLSVLVKEHEITPGPTFDWSNDPLQHCREYSCLHHGVRFIHRFNLETWEQALRRAELNIEEHPRPDGLEEK